MPPLYDVRPVRYFPPQRPLTDAEWRKLREENLRRTAAAAGKMRRGQQR